MFNKIIGMINYSDKRNRSDIWIFSIILVASGLSLLAAFTLSIEAIELIKNPNALLSCSINDVINCATVAKTSFSSLFGFPNSFLGMMVEPVFMVIAIAGLCRIKLSRVFMFGVQILSALALMFAYYLFFIGYFIIHAICPWCFLVTIATTFIFFAITRYNIREDNLYLSNKHSSEAKKIIAKDYDKLAVAIILSVVIASLIMRYGNGLFE